MSYAVDAAWIAIGVVWLVGAFHNKQTVRRLPAGRRVVHFLILGVGFSFLMRRSLRIGPLAWRFVPDIGTVDLVGNALEIVGLAFAIWARLHLGRNWSAEPTLKQGHALIRGGPYAAVRHPIYSGLLLAIFGKALEHGDLAGLVGAAIFLVEWKRKSLIEEQFLLEQFGHEYARYRGEVKGLIPGVW